MLPVIEIALPAQPGGSVPAFLAKLWKMVDNPETNSLINWSPDGSSFVIRNQGEFTKTLLPYYYKHSNMASFVRQLNMYGFHKVMSVESGGLKADKDEVEFAHTFFLRGQEHLLDQIKRKVTVGGRGENKLSQFVPSIKSEKVTEVLSEVGVLKERQEDLDNKLENMRSENEALWGEVLSLRQKHNQQQKIVNKLIQFLSALLQPRGMKRTFARAAAGAPSQLAIEDIGKVDTATAKVAAPSGPSLPKQAKFSEARGPTIQELPANLHPSQLSSVLSKLSSPDLITSDPIVDIIIDPNNIVKVDSVPVPQVQAQTVNKEQSKYTMVDPVSVNSSLVKRPVLQRELSREDFDTVINTNEKDLDNLKDILSGQITVDTSLINSIFTNENEPNNLNLFSDYTFPDADQDSGAADISESDSNQISKYVTYNPSLFELADADADDEIIAEQSPFSDPSVLLTPMIQDDQTDPLKKLFEK